MTWPACAYDEWKREDMSPFLPPLPNMGRGRFSPFEWLIVALPLIAAGAPLAPAQEGHADARAELVLSDLPPKGSKDGERT
jgi:hypothetical protein